MNLLSYVRTVSIGFVVFSYATLEVQTKEPAKAHDLSRTAVSYPTPASFKTKEPIENQQPADSPEVEQAQTFLSKGDYRSAIQKCTFAINHNSKDAQAYLCRGLALSLIDRSHAAIIDLERGFQLSHGLVAAQYYIQAADCHVTLNEFDQALADMDLAIKIKPKSAAAYREKGQILSNLKRNEEALKCFSKSIEINPNFHWTYDDRSRCYVQLGRLKDALADVNTIVKLNPADSRGYVTRALIYDRLGDKKSAARDRLKSDELIKTEFN